jgi:ubiquitin fusion degradation protein 1
LNEGALITVTNVTLPKAKFVKFRAQSCDFLEISNPRAGALMNIMLQFC